MLDTLRIVSTEDVGHDEASVQSLVKKHKNITEELGNYKKVIQALTEQAGQLGEQVRLQIYMAQANIECKFAFFVVFFSLNAMFGL